ncbi:MAG TPA: DUF4437 domain-containing protein [Kofleriaceae bacterium]|nr:DUF4437 domain-containing protein [Kofleriaceae bacterium]
MKAVVIAAIVGFSATLANAGPAPKLVAVPSGELKWEPFFPGGPDEAFVVGSKDAKKGPTAFFIKFKAGFDSGWHTHGSAYTGIVLSGTIIETSKGQDAVKLGAGSYYNQPVVVHKTQCAPGADCVAYIYEDSAFSFTPTDESGKPLPASAPKK